MELASTGTSHRWVHTGFAQQLIFGDNVVDELGRFLRDAGMRRALLVSTAGRLESPDGKRLIAAAGDRIASTFADVSSHVPAPAVQAALRQVRRDAVDGIVSFGGGSCADLAKAVGFFHEQEQGVPGARYTDRPALPHVAVPTTYSGAELTPFFGMTDPQTRRKQGAGGPTCAPIAVFYDPTLTLSTPAKVSAETGMNALAHCVEILWSRTASPEAMAIAEAGIRIITSALPEVVAAPENLATRSSMLEGAALAGRCLQNGSMGVHHGLCQLLGGRTGVSHGLANAVVLPHAVRFNTPEVPEAISRLRQAMGLGADADAALAIERLVETLGLPTRLLDCGVTPDDLDSVARQSQGNGNIAANPRPVSEADARSILEDAY